MAYPFFLKTEISVFNRIVYCHIIFNFQIKDEIPAMPFLL